MCRTEMEEGIQIRTRLLKRQKQEIKQLLEKYEKKDQGKPDFFMEQEWNEVLDCPCFFLLYRKGQLLCAVSAFLAEKEAEISAVTRKEWQGKGLFAQVLKEGIAVLKKYGFQRISFRIFDWNDTAQQILEHWKYQKIKTDCLMILFANKIKTWQPLEERSGRTAVLEGLEAEERKQMIIEIHSSAFGCLKSESEWLLKNNFSDGIRLWGYWREHQLIGLCFVSESKQGYFLSGVSIWKKEQQKGYGEAFLRELLLNLQEKERKDVFLQVSGENEGAVRLYQKLGFFTLQCLVTYSADLK